MKDIQSKLSSSNIIQELFSSFAARWASKWSAYSLFLNWTFFSHKPVMEMEIEVLYQTFTNQGPKVLIDHIKSVAAGEVSYFPTTLALVYDRLVGRAIQKHPSSSDSEKPPKGQKVTTSKAQSSVFDSAPPYTSNASSSTNPTTTRFPAATSVPSTTLIPTAPPINRVSLQCIRCRGTALLGQLYDGLHCPWCPATGRNGKGVKGRPFMVCPECRKLRETRVNTCPKAQCRVAFQ